MHTVVFEKHVLAHLTHDLNHPKQGEVPHELE
jgi:hypothetical protein